MLKIHIFMLSLSALSAAAVTVDVPQLPAPAFSGWEVSSDTALPSNRTNELRVFRLELTFDATPSNNVQVAYVVAGKTCARRRPQFSSFPRGGHVQCLFPVGSSPKTGRVDHPSA